MTQAAAKPLRIPLTATQTLARAFCTKVRYRHGGDWGAGSQMLITPDGDYVPPQRLSRDNWAEYELKIAGQTVRWRAYADLPTSPHPSTTA